MLTAAVKAGRLGSSSLLYKRLGSSEPRPFSPFMNYRERMNSISWECTCVLGSLKMFWKERKADKLHVWKDWLWLLSRYMPRLIA